MGALDISITGLNVARAQLDVTANNISNASTPGYTRQRALISNVQGDAASGQLIGSGVQLDRIERLADQFAISQLRSSTTAFSESDIFHRIAERTDNLVSNETTSLSSALEDYFGALNEGVNDPTSVSLRQNILGEAGRLTSRFHAIETEISQLTSEVNREMTDAANNITQIAKRVAIVNDQVRDAVGAGGGATPNDLLDERDRLLEELAKFVNISAFENADGTVDVSVGSGQSLVTGGTSITVVAEASAQDASIKNLFLKDIKKNVTTDITKEVQGGRVKGLIDVRNDLLDPALRELGLVAAGLIQTTNTQHKVGMDFNSALGQDFFKDLNLSTIVKQRVLPNSANKGTATLSVELGEFAADTVSIPNKPATGVKDLEAEEYELIITGTSFELIRQSDQASVTSGAISEFPIQVQGMKISLTTGGFVDKDRYLIRPMQGLARGIEVDITDPKKLALAWPVEAREAQTNLGSGKIQVTDMVSTNQPVNFSNLSTTSDTLIATQPALVSKLTDLNTPQSGDLLFSVAGATADDVAIPAAPIDPSARALFDAITANVAGVTPTAQTTLDLGAYTDGDWLGASGSDFTVETFGGASGANLAATPLGIAAGVRDVEEVVTAITALSGNISAQADLVVKSQTGEPLNITLGPTALAAGLSFDSEAKEIMNIGQYNGGVIAAEDLVINGIQLGATYADTTAIRDAIRTAGNSTTLEQKFTADAHVVVTENQGKTIKISTTGNNGGTQANFSNFSLTGAAQENFQKGQVTVTAAVAGSTLKVSGNNPEYGGFVEGVALNIPRNAFHPDRPGQLDPPIKIQFIDDTCYQVYAMSGTLKPIGNVQHYDPQNPDVFPLVDSTTVPATNYDPGYRIQITGTPTKGDMFTVGYNTDGIGDNSNAIELAKIQQEKVLTADSLGNATNSISQGYENLISSVATKTETSIIDLNASETLQKQAQQKRDSIMGVNLDEEAANLVQFQQAFQASARAITVAQNMFDTLIQAVG
ncbi:flagellar hook-associated protein FlgK [Piscirickettsia litoralis]|uniref:Flagellar hook-associated protein 1 n=1 Tax=Piscirickettsia litoralis TaxID=1891921 RepID=A0ABX2ZZF9_9GAMM|nr:flagellar hook-associated protein FlgK [Piscirickettsia litoralis]ODN41997.1 flagellar hook-associated protein FlgK [Piscirickettsia litoralis]